MQETISGGQGQGEGGYLDCTGLPFQTRLALHPFTLWRAPFSTPSHSHCYTGIWGPSRGEKASNRRQGEHRITCGNSPLAHWSILGRCALRALWHTKQLTESSWHLCDRPISCYLALLKQQSSFKGNHFGFLSQKNLNTVLTLSTS